MREGLTNTVVVDDTLNPRAVSALLHFAHVASELVVSDDDLEDTACAADQLCFSAALAPLAQRLVDTTTPSNALARVSLCQRLDIPALKQGVLRSLTADVTSSPEFLGISFDAFAFVWTMPLSSRRMISSSSESYLLVKYAPRIRSIHRRQRA